MLKNVLLQDSRLLHWWLQDYLNHYTTRGRQDTYEGSTHVPYLCRSKQVSKSKLSSPSLLEFIHKSICIQNHIIREELTLKIYWFRVFPVSLATKSSEERKPDLPYRTSHSPAGRSLTCASYRLSRIWIKIIHLLVRMAQNVWAQNDEYDEW
jgi:hypothetical protein